MRKISREGLALASLLVTLGAGCKKPEADQANDAEGGITTTTTTATTASTPLGKASGSAFGTSFEGAITMSMTSSGHPPTEMTFLTKGNKLRFEGPGHVGGGHAIFDASTKKVTMMLDGQKMYVELDLSQPLATAPRGDTAKPTITETGKHETIAGYDCEDWTIKDAKGHKSEACMAQGISFLDFSSLGGGAHGAPGGGSWMDEFRDKKFFPLRAVELDDANNQTSRMEVTKIEAKPLDDALFVPPAGYKKMDMPTLPAGFPGMGALHK